MRNTIIVSQKEDVSFSLEELPPSSLPLPIQIQMPEVSIHQDSTLMLYNDFEAKPMEAKLDQEKTFEAKKQEEIAEVSDINSSQYMTGFTAGGNDIKSNYATPEQVIVTA